MTYFVGRVPMNQHGTIIIKSNNGDRLPFLLQIIPEFVEILKRLLEKGGEFLEGVIKNPLSNELKVAAEIFGCQERGEKVWLGKLQERLVGEVSKNTISAALDTLFDWGIIKAEYGETEKGRAGRLLMISNESTPLIKELYEKYWKNR